MSRSERPSAPPAPPAPSDTDTNNAGAAPVEANHRQSRPSSANKASCQPYLHNEPLSELEEGHSSDPGVAQRDSSAGLSKEREREREERVRMARERQQDERRKKLDELREQALAAQRFMQQKADERRKRIDEMRLRDTDRRLQVEERKRAIWEAERERREAIVRRNEEREARMEQKKKSNGNAGVFAFGSSTPRMLEPADTGGTFWGHRRATSTSNVMFAALPLSRRSSERELDPNKKRATSASGLDRQPGEDYRMSSSMYEVFHWHEFGASDTPARPYSHQMMGNQEDGGASSEQMPWSRVARRRTDLVPTIPASRDGSRGGAGGSATPRPPGRAYSMSRLDQLSQPRRPRPVIPPPPPPHHPSHPPTRPPRHRSMGNLAAAAAKASHRSTGNLAAATAAASTGPSPPPRKHPRAATATTPAQQGSSLRSGEVTPGSPSRPGSSMSSASTTGGIMTSSVTGVIVNRRPRAAPRRPRPASIAGTGVSTPHVKNATPDGKVVGDKPPLPRVHSAGLSNKKPATVNQPSPPTPSTEKPQVPRRTHKTISQKSPRLTPRSTPLQSPATDLPPPLQDVVETTASQEIVREGSNDTITLSDSKLDHIEEDFKNDSAIDDTVTKQITKDEEIVSEKPPAPVTNICTLSNEVVEPELVTIINEEIDLSNFKSDELPAQSIEDIEKLKLDDNKETVSKEKESTQVVDPLEGADMTSSMMAKRITTEGEAKAALAERRRQAREEAERQAERERLRLELEAAEEAERQRQEEERQRRLEEETIRLSELQRQAEEERLQQAILEAQKRAEEENVRREEEARAKAEREAAEARAREEAEKQRKETAQRLKLEEQEREARRKRVEAIMLRTRQAKQNKKDDDKSPSDENKSMDDGESKSNDGKLTESVSDTKLSEHVQDNMDRESAYEMSVREREEDLLNISARHNQMKQQQQQQQDASSNGINLLRNGTSLSSNGSLGSLKDSSIVDTDLLQSNKYTAQNGHSKNEINELNNFLNNSENQFNNLALDNTAKQNMTNNILDISDLDLLNTANSNSQLINTNGNLPMQTSNTLQDETNLVNQIIDVSVDTMSKSLINEDSINSNQPNISPFITSFQDNQENRDVSLL